jgi:hypothetical protein
VSNWELNGKHDCDGGCNWGACGGHKVRLEIQDTSDTFTYYREDKLVMSGYVEELVELKKIIERAEEFGLV